VDARPVTSTADQFRRYGAVIDRGDWAMTTRREKILAMLETEAVCGGYLVAGLAKREATLMRQEVLRLGVISIQRTSSTNNFVTALIAMERHGRMAAWRPIGPARVYQSAELR
jgi:hypothetical protein